MKTVFPLVGSSIGWLAIGLQLYLMFQSPQAPEAGETLIRFFSYFTILTNLLCALHFTLLLCMPGSRLGRFLCRPQTILHLTVYILVVGAIYNTILRFLWAPEGLARLVDEALHSFLPLWFGLYWVVQAPKTQISWKHIPGGLVYPLLYLGYIMLRGSFADWYPYPFVNVTELGAGPVALNCLAVALLFTLLLTLFTALARGLSGRQRKI